MQNSLRYYKQMILEYELVKTGRHAKFKLAKEFYEYYSLKKQTFLKFYNRYKMSRDDYDLLPKKRGAKFINLLENGVSGACSKKYIPFITNKVVNLREKGFNKYEINSALKIKLGEKNTPSIATVYRIFKRKGLNKKTRKMVENKRKIIKENPGEMGHVDCHYLPKGLIKNEPTKRYFLLAVIDDCTRICWVEVIENVKSLTVMFATLQCLNRIYDEFGFKIKEMLTDNGSEFTSKSNDIETKKQHPFERLMLELGIKQRKTKPYRPQTNGKIERFWRTIEDEAIDGTDYLNLEELKDTILKYNVYYNQIRQHQSLNNKTPEEFLKGVEKLV